MIAACFVLLGAALIVFARSYGVFGRVGIKPRLIASVLFWLVAVVGIWLALNQSGFDAERAGFWTFGWNQIGIGFLFGILGLITFPIFIFLSSKFGGKPPETDTLETFASGSIPQRLFLLATAAGAEEVIFRGVAIGGLMAAGVHHWLAVILPLAVFVVLHRSSWGLLHLIFVTVAGSLMTAAFILGGLWAAILAHFIVDAPMFVAGKAMIRRKAHNRVEEQGNH